MPQRKKLSLSIFRHMPTKQKYVMNISPADGPTAYEYRGDQIGYAFKLPVPEKAQKQWNYVILCKPNLTLEPLLWTVPDGPIKIAYNQKTDPVDAKESASNSITDLDEVLSEALKQVDLQLIQPEDEQFVSTLHESHRKQDSCYHVKAHRGSKDGYLFFLSTGIFFGFKKPLLFLSLAAIDSISYTSVLQRTFNLNINYREGQHEEETEVEFSMLDQADYGGIDAYIKRHGLNDASLAEGRRAKVHNVNRGRAAHTNGEDGEAKGEDDGRTELEKAEQQLQDEEDEMEEDFELESGDGDSDGSGESEDEGYVEGEENNNLVADELGSEAEDVDNEEDEEDEEDEEEDAEAEEEEHETDDKTDPQTRDAKKAAAHAISAPLSKLPEPEPDDEDQL